MCTFNKFFYVLIFVCLTMFSCNTQRKLEKEAIKKQKEAIERQDARKAERMMDYEISMQKHYDIQSKETQKMMRKSYKKTERAMLGKKEPLLTRIQKKLFPEKRKTKRRKATK